MKRPSFFTKIPKSKIHCPDSKTQQHTNNQIAKCPGQSPTQRATMQWRTKCNNIRPTFKSKVHNPKSKVKSPKADNNQCKAQRLKARVLVRVLCNIHKIMLVLVLCKHACARALPKYVCSCSATFTNSCSATFTNIRVLVLCKNTCALQHSQNHALPKYECYSPATFTKLQSAEFDGKFKEMILVLKQNLSDPSSSSCSLSSNKKDTRAQTKFVRSFKICQIQNTANKSKDLLFQRRDQTTLELTRKFGTSSKSVCSCSAKIRVLVLCNIHKIMLCNIHKNTLFLLC